jgi:hypothetical protein
VSPQWPPSLMFPHQNPIKTCTLPSSIHSTCPADHIHLDFITRTKVGEQLRSLSSSLWTFLHSPVTSSPLGPNTPLNTLFPNTLSLRSALNFSYQFHLSLTSYKKATHLQDGLYTFSKFSSSNVNCLINTISGCSYLNYFRSCECNKRSTPDPSPYNRLVFAQLLLRHTGYLCGQEQKLVDLFIICYLVFVGGWFVMPLHSYALRLLRMKRILLCISNQSVPRCKHFPPRL